MNEHYYLYALTWAGCPPESFGPGVDPRFAVELVRCGQLAALTSRVGLDQFDLAKLQEGTADLPWVSQVAVRHNEIIGAAARRWPVLPMRLGTLFQSRASLVAKVARCEADAVEFLRQLEDRQEWAVKIYVDEDRAEKAVLSGPAPPGKRAPLADYLPARPRARVDPPHTAAGVRPAIKGLTHPNPRTPGNARAPAEAAGGGGGTQYLAAKGLQAERRRQVQASISQAVLAVEARLQGVTDAWHRLRPLPAAVTNRPEKMVWNGAFLLPKSAMGAFHAACERLGSELSPKGLMVEATGPWPPYHFCPTLDPEGESRAAAPAGH